MEMKQNYKIQGLDCSEEVAILKKELGSKDGVIALDFDVFNARMTVTFDSQIISEQQIIESVDSTGMKAIAWQQRADQKKEFFWQSKGRLIMTCLSAGFLLAGFIIHWYIHGSFFDVLLGGLGEEHVTPELSIALYVCAIMAGAWFVAPKALFAAKKLRPDMNLLMVVAIIGAMILGEWFEGAMVSFLFALSLLLEHWSVERSRRAIGSLLEMTPKTARCRDTESGEIREVQVEEISVGTTIIIRPGEKIPLDGIISSGSTTVNQAPITGESMPVKKNVDDEVYAGTINQDGAIEIEAKKAASDTTLARIIHMVEEAQSRRAPFQQWVDKFAYFYTPAMMVLATAIAVFPPLLFSADWIDWIYRGLVILVIACPCALVIATPVSIVSALTVSARNGVLIKGGVYIEMIGHLKAVAFDKTGTLTIGQPEVQQVIPLNNHTSKELLATAAALEANSEHHLAKAILRKAQSQGINIQAAEDFQAIKGKGADGRIDGELFWIGSHRLMHERGEDTLDVHAKILGFEDAGHTVVVIGNDDHVCGIITIADGIRPIAKKAIADIKKAGIEAIVMLTGDNSGTAAAIAGQIGVDDYKAELLPEDKVAAVEMLVHKYGKVAMVGDGINDAPALATATCGIAMGAMGTDAALETADIALMSDELEKIPWLIYKSRNTLKIIKQNIAFSLGLKLLFITLTLFGLASLWMAIAADTGATLLVTFNALRLLKL
ncbi:MAG TPA: heavy metal translocating P-type ATPase [Anaerohalosphaeraceae bacterium]|nr:heavy metal translocating P-type ATPase [Anaerohalosphaeraceae bacterium]